MNSPAAMSTSAVRLPSGSTSLRSLLDALPAASREKYWDALCRFLRFELDRPSFEEAAQAALGPLVPRHNELIREILRGSLAAPAAELEAARAEAAAAANRRRRAVGRDAPRRAAARAATLRDAAPQPVAAAPAAPKISLKIRRDEAAGSRRRWSRRHAVDPPEEAQLNALHERLQKIAREHVPTCSPRRPRSCTARRARTSTASSPRARSARTARRGPPPSPPIAHAAARAAVRQPVVATWMPPPCRRPGSVRTPSSRANA